MDLNKKLGRIPQLKQIKALAGKHQVEVYLVGGFLRDCYLKRDKDCFDFDFILSKQARKVAAQLAKELGRKLIVLDEAEKTYRIVVKKDDREYQYDFAQLRGKTLDDDLGARDFPINALCIDLASYPHCKIYDPLEGVGDIKRKVIRLIGEKNIIADPLRILRAFSLQARFGFKLAPASLTILSKHKAKLKKVSVERIVEEFFKIFASDKSYPIIKTLSEEYILDEFIPAIKPSRGLIQEGGYHHLDVWAHSLEALLRFEILCQRKLFKNPEFVAYLNEELAAKHTRLQLIKIACLLHDIGKPRAKKKKGKKTIFHLHEKYGAQMVKDIAKKLKLSVRETESLGRLVFWHLRPGYLADIRYPSARAIYRFFRDTQDDGAGVILLSLADWRATRGPKTSRDEKIKHSYVMLKLLDRYFAEKKKKPLLKLLNGFDLMREFKLQPSPLVGEILNKVREEQVLGHIKTKTQAYSLARKIMGGIKTDET
jgi:poly(A) polymerase